VTQLALYVIKALMQTPGKTNSDYSSAAIGNSMIKIRFILISQTLHISTCLLKSIGELPKVLNCLFYLAMCLKILPDFSIRTGKGSIAMQPASSPGVFKFGRRQSGRHSKSFFFCPMALPMEPL